MRYLIAASAVLALAACNVNKDENGVSVQYDQNTAENAVADVSNTAGNIAGHISNDVSETADKVDARTDGDGDAPANAAENK
ncbi:MAG TPA: hypothetical protein VIL42_11315 [Sphingomicrobium sp.]|jgi:hypothetical protein